MGWVGKGHEGKRNDGKEVKDWAMGGRIAEGKEREGRGEGKEHALLGPFSQNSRAATVTDSL